MILAFMRPLYRLLQVVDPFAPPQLTRHHLLGRWNVIRKGRNGVRPAFWTMMSVASKEKLEQKEAEDAAVPASRSAPSDFQHLWAFRGVVSPAHVFL